MSSVQQRVSSLILKEVCIHNNLSEKLINIRALAKYLINKYDLNVSLDSVISAIRRSDIKKIKEDQNNIALFLKGAIVSTRNNIACVTLKSFKFSDLLKLSDIKGLNFIKGNHKFKIIIDKKNVKGINDLFSTKINRLEDDLSEISVNLNEGVYEQKGILAEIVNSIFINDINISEILICPPEFLILVKSKDMVKTYEIIIKLTQ